MRIVQLDCDLIRENGEIRMGFLEPAEDILNRRRDEEVLLFEPEFLAFEHIVVGIQNLGYVFRYRFCGDSLDIVAVIEVVEVKFA